MGADPIGEWVSRLVSSSFFPFSVFLLFRLQMLSLSVLSASSLFQIGHGDLRGHFVRARFVAPLLVVPQVFFHVTVCIWFHLDF
jgi:hypothetical protein